ncbi:MAG: hypothetical protein VYE73_11945 [Acidobacteriota bacterium]|nr:hypothetical protein [Acidobacteriota bacterium]
MKTLLRTLCLLLAVPASADWVYLENGNRLQGTSQTLANGDFEITTAGGTLQLPAGLSERVESAASSESLADDELRTLSNDDAAGRFDLALRVEAAGASTLARRILGEVVRIDPGHEEARRRLGQVECDGKWLTELECHERRRQLYYRGRWIASSEWARIEALEVQRRAMDLEGRLQDARLAPLQVRSQETRPVYGPYYQPYYWGSGYVAAAPTLASRAPVLPRLGPVARPAPRATAPNPSNRSSFRAPDRPFLGGSAPPLQR